MSLVVDTCDPNTWKIKEGESRVQGQPLLHSEASLGYMRPSKTKENKQTKIPNQNRSKWTNLLYKMIKIRVK